MKRGKSPAFPAFRNAVLIILFVVAGTASLVAAFSHLDGPVERCEAAGGHMLVGPGGETSCISPYTFLPLEAFSPGQTVR